ncbi:DUF2235 domain-containing protein [Synechocystis sp. FACHB-383]|uniref:phospholipase effector Tle1 domain-containing protein n=1 Tax=Synechocystis sp. FACHB-383 TaxID=2692864 RepID=UPI001682478E|nr:DUF2235 domain-containing protein [Synechocystis sp. FACHB-383]MBD2655417.1 DUF2235 domain-containing protein [Synechocystis sp. FACHB-383]
MALYAFDGTGDRWNPGTRWNIADLRSLTPDQRQNLLNTITSVARTENNRFLTNVVFFYKEYVGSGLHAEYFPGVGSGAWFETNTGRTLDFIFGGAFGIGAQGIVNQAFKRLKKNFTKGDKVIDIIGFSRGAAIARMFADKTAIHFRKIGDKLERPPEIRFIGLFDTVASFGNPFNENEIFFQNNLPWTVRNAYHAMSLDLNRAGFGLDRAFGNHVLEVWFRGGHGDVGGNSSLADGTSNRLRANISLNFMLKKAIACGVELTTGGLTGNDRSNQANDYPIDISSPVSVDDNNSLNRAAGQDPTRQPRRSDVFHYSLFDENRQQLRPIDTWTGRQIYSHPKLVSYDQVVIEEIDNESQTSDLRVLHLTPELFKKFPDTQSIYDYLYK